MNHFFLRISALLCLIIFGCQDDRIQLPIAAAFPKQIGLTSERPNTQIVLSGSGQFDLSWSLAYKPDWLHVSPTSGYIQNGVIEIIARTENLLPQTLTDQIIISTTTGNIEIPVTLSITFSNAVQLTLLPFIDYHETTKEFSIINHSDEPASWTIETTANYLSISPASGTLNAGQTSLLTLSVDRSDLETKDYTGELVLKIGGIQSFDMNLLIKSFKEEKWLLDGPVTDSEYDRAGDNLVVVIDNQLQKLKPDSREIESVILPKPGTCVSVSKDGMYAAVGHESLISLVDLTQMQIEKTFPISFSAWDIVLAPNDWIYAFPKGSNDTRITCVNILDGSQVLSSGTQIHGNTKARLHPSGDYIYGWRNGLCPYDAEKYDIRNGQAIYLYESPYHGEHEFIDQPWITDDGDRIFTPEGKIFNASTTQSEDLIYQGSLSIEHNLWIQAFDHNGLTNRICAVYFDYHKDPDECKAQIFSGDDLNALATVTLPGFLVGQPSSFQIVPSEGAYGFFNSGGTKFHAIVRSRTFTSEVYWAVTTINVD